MWRINISNEKYGLSFNQDLSGVKEEDLKKALEITHFYIECILRGELSVSFIKRVDINVNEMINEVLKSVLDSLKVSESSEDDTFNWECWLPLPKTIKSLPNISVHSNKKI